MPLYEHVYLARQDVSAQQVETLTAQYKGVIEQLGGKVAKTEYWGVKSLSYRIRKNRKAHMTLFNVDAPAAARSIGVIAAIVEIAATGASAGATATRGRRARARTNPHLPPRTGSRRP